MSRQSRLDLQSIKGSLNELKGRVLFIIKALVVFRIGSFIPVPGINSDIVTKILDQKKGTIIEMFNMFSGGALSHASILTLGIMPYISASIIIQLLTLVYPSLIEMKKEGEIGRKKINQYTQYATLILALFQSIGIAIALPNMPDIKGLVIHSGVTFYFTTVVSLVCGTMFLIWLGEQITERGVGNGISIIIFSGIVAGLPSAIAHTIEQIRTGNMHVFILLLVIILVFAVVFFVVFIERGQRRIVVSYARRQRGRYIYYSQQNTHLPLKINMAGVIPAIFASGIVLFPATIISWIANSAKWKWLLLGAFYLQPGHIIYILLYTVSIVFFCFFYTTLMFNSRETAENLKKSGAFIPGIRPGEQTAKYIHQVITRLTLIGSVYIVFICLIPEFMRSAMKVPFYFGGTSLLIVVVVIMDFITQVQTLIMSNQYESALKRANLKK